MVEVRYRNKDAIVLVLSLLILGLAVAASPRASAAAESERELFEKAYDYYLDYRPDVAASAFGLFSERFSRSPARDAALFWQAKSLMATGNEGEARQIFESIRAEYPDSPFAEFARKELGAIAPVLKRSRGKDREGGIAALSEKDRILRDDLANAVAELMKTKKERDAAVAALRKAEFRLSEVKDAAVRLREREKLQNERDAYIKKLEDEMADLRASLKERDRKLSGDEKAIALLRSRLQDTEPKGGASVLKGRDARLDAPVVRIGEKTYTVSEIAEENRIAARVLSKIGAAASWRKGDGHEDFVTGRLLAARATEGDRKAAAGEAAKYEKRYPFTGSEKEYLSLYLTAERVIGRKKNGDVPDEKDLKDYYETHKREYLEKKEERYVKYLVMKYRKSDKRGGVALVSELQREAGKGRSFEEIARSVTGKVSLRRVKLEELPAWIGKKIRVLKDGEISSIFTEDQFIMLRMQVKAPVYRKYEDVRKEIRKRLSPEKKGPVDLDTWLADLRKDAVEVK
jgi:TolA-binding protein